MKIYKPFKAAFTLTTPCRDAAAELIAQTSPGNYSKQYLEQFEEGYEKSRLSSDSITFSSRVILNAFNQVDIFDKNYPNQAYGNWNVHWYYVGYLTGLLINKPKGLLSFSKELQSVKKIIEQKKEQKVWEFLQEAAILWKKKIERLGRENPFSPAEQKGYKEIKSIFGV